MIKLICALGNKGKEYSKTRHNAGWMIVDTLDLELNYQRKFKGIYADYFIAPGKKAVFLKPETYMNKSGESLRSCMDFFSITPAEILVVHDDLELAYGKIEMKNQGGLGGHNGLKSIVQHLGTKDFKRLRFGIGRPKHGSVADFVLSRFSKDEEIDLDMHIQAAANILMQQLNS